MMRARGAHHETLTDQVGLGNGLHGLRLLPHAHGQRGEPDRTPVEPRAQGLEHLAVEPVQAQGVHLEDLERAAGGRQKMKCAWCR